MQDSEYIAPARAWALDNYAKGNISEETLNQILEDIEVQEDEADYHISPEAELHRLGMTEGQYSISPTFGAEIDAWDGKSEKTFYVGNTSDALQSIGVKSSGIVWHSGKINKIMQKHSAMTKEIIKQVPEILEHPVAVLASKQSDSRIVIFGTVVDANNNPVTAILELQPTTKGGQLLDMTVIASAYGKEGNVAKFVESSGLLYLDPDRKRTENWMQGLGLQLPSDATVLGSIGSISYPGGNVKIESVPYNQYMQSADDDASTGRQYSISQPMVNKADVISSLRSILNKGGDPAALRQYVASLEQNTGKTERRGENAYQNASFAERNAEYAYQAEDTAEKILEAAHRQGVSVEEYLEMNWERFDVDGQWNENARKALELEESAAGTTGRQFSISMPVDDEQNNGYSKANLELRGEPKNMPRKSAEWHAFNRSFANKTMGIKDGEEREIYIITAGYVYFVTADGYMQGYVNERIRISKNKIAHIQEMEEYIDELNKNREDPDSWIEGVQADKGRDNWDNDNSEGRETTTDIDRISFEEQNGNIPGDFERSEEDYSWLEEEYLPGTLVYGDDGKSYKANDEGLLVPLDERQYSISETEGVENSATESETGKTVEGLSLPKPGEPDAGMEADSGTDADVRSKLPRKAQRYLKRAERTLLNNLCKSLDVPWFARRSYLQPMVEEISNEYLRSGTVSQETIDRIFETAYEEGVVVDREFYDQYVELKKFMQKNPVTLHESNRADIADFDEFKKRNRWNVRIVNEGGLSVDSAYRELREMAPRGIVCIFCRWQK